MKNLHPMSMTKILFWVGAAGLFYTYLGYPLLLHILQRLCCRPVKKGVFSGRVSVVVVAYNEEACIGEKLRSILSSVQAGRITEILVASDGSTDRTVAEARSVGDARVRVLDFPVRRGKPSVLNEVIPLCGSDIVVLTDARQTLHTDALGRMLENFADPEIGVVSGELVFTETAKPSATAEGVSRYWNYEKSIRKAESRIGSVPGATGALYAFRKGLFAPIPPATLLDDVVIPMQIICRGFRCVLEEGAIAWDRPSASLEAERIRKRRTLAGNLQLVALYPRWLWPGSNPIWFQFVSHKLLRLLTPFFLVGMLGASLALWKEPFYRGCAMIQAVFYVLTAGAWMAQNLGRRMAWMGLPLSFMALNLAIVQAWGDALRGRYEVRWRSSPPTQGE